MSVRDRAVNAWINSLCAPRRTLTILAALATPALILAAKRVHR